MSLKINWTETEESRDLQALTHEPSRVGDISADFAVDLDEPLHADLLHFVARQRILQAVPQEDDERQALPQLVGTGGGTRSLKGGENRDVNSMRYIDF